MNGLKGVGQAVLVVLAVIGAFTVFFFVTCLATIALSK
jgi:hypothetical protein